MTTRSLGESASVISEFNGQAHDILIEKAHGLHNLLEKNAGLHEELGKLCPDVIASLEEMGAFRMALPRRLGGLGASASTSAEVLLILAKACPSTAWVVMILNSVGWLASRMPAAMVEVIMADGAPKICGPHNGTGRLVADGEDYLVTGSWKYASGCHHANWAIVPVTDEADAAHLVAIRMRDVEIQKTWLVAGMKGTGSDTIVASNLKVSKLQVADAACMQIEGPIASVRFPEPVDSFLYSPMTRCLTIGVLQGAAEGLLECATAAANQPIVYTVYSAKSGSQYFQAGIGEVVAKLATSEVVIQSMTRAIDDISENFRAVPFSERALWRGKSAVALELLSQSVDKMMSLSGSSSFFNSNRAQRYWRDFNVGARHVIFNQGVAFECLGRTALSVEPNIVPIQMV